MKAGFAFALLVALIAIGIFVALRATAPGPASEGDFDTPMPAMVPGAADGEELLVPAKDEAPDHPRAVVDDPKAPAPAAEEAREAPGGLRAQVVDAEGRPRGGVPVGLFDIRPERPIPRPFVQAESAQGTGIATLILPRVADVPPPPELRYAVGIYLPLDPPVLHDIGADFPTPDQEVLPLVLPAEGEAWLAPLRVQVVDPHGEPVIGARVEYRAVPRLSPEDANRLEHRYTRAPDAIVSFPREKQRESVLYAEVLRRAVDYEMVVTGPFLSPPPAPRCLRRRPPSWCASSSPPPERSRCEWCTSTAHRSLEMPTPSSSGSRRERRSAPATCGSRSRTESRAFPTWGSV